MSRFRGDHFFYVFRGDHPLKGGIVVYWVLAGLRLPLFFSLNLFYYFTKEGGYGIIDSKNLNEFE